MGYGYSCFRKIGMKPHSGWRYGTPFLKRRCNPTVRSRNPPLEWLHETNLRFLRLRTPLGQQAKPCGILNVAGYYTPLLAMFDQAVEERFLKPENRGLVLARELPADLLQALERWRPPHVSILASLYVLALGPPNRSIPFKYFLVALQSQRRADRTSPEGVRPHLPSLEQDEPRIMSNDRRDVVNLHPALGLPAHELHFLGGQMLSAHHSRGAVIFLEPLTHDQALIAEILRHGCAGGRSRVLNVRPVHVTACKFEVGFDRLACVARTANDQPADHIHLVAVQVTNGFQSGISRVLAVRALRVLSGGAQKFQVAFQDILDAEKDVAESGSPHQWS